MFSFFNRFFKSDEQRLSDYLNQTKVVKVQGLRFTIRRVNIYDYLDGSKTLTQYYAFYQAGKITDAENQLKKVNEHYKDVFMSAVVKPILKRKDDPNDEAIFVGEITNNFVLASQLYTEIMAFTDGLKKKRI